MWALKESSGAATAEASDVSFKQADGEIGERRQHHADRLRQHDDPESHQLRHADRERRLGLAAGDRLDAGAEHLAEHGAAVEPEADHRSRDWREADAQRGEAEVDDEELRQHRHGAEQLDIDLSQAAQQPRLRGLESGEDEAEQDRDDEAADRDDHGHDRPGEEEADEAGQMLPGARPAAGHDGRRRPSTAPRKAWVRVCDGAWNSRLGGPFLDHHAAVHEDHAIRDVLGELHLVGDDHHGHALGCEAGHDVQDLTDELGIERGGRLVEQHQPRLHGQRPSDGDALLLAAREHVRIDVAFLRNADLGQEVAP